MKIKITIIRVLIFAVVTLFIILPAAANENVTDHRIDLYIISYPAKLQTEQL
jgi:hypothetical protein